MARSPIAMARLGHDVLAIDPRAPEGERFERVTLEELADPGPFDAVVANRSLHHIHDLAAAVEKIARLLAPGGRLLLHEHAWDVVDEPTQRWYREQGGRSADWRADHAGLHSSEAMLAALAPRFAERLAGVDAVPARRARRRARRLSGWRSSPGPSARPGSCTSESSVA